MIRYLCCSYCLNCSTFKICLLERHTEIYATFTRKQTKKNLLLKSLSYRLCDLGFVYINGQSHKRKAILNHKRMETFQHQTIFRIEPFQGASKKERINS